MAPKKNRTAPASTETTTGTKPHTISRGVLVGRAAERLLKLEAEERAALARSPEAIKLSFAKKREETLKELSEAEKKGALAMAEAMRPVAEDDSKAAAE